MTALQEIAAERDYWKEYALQLERALAPDVVPEEIRIRLQRSHAVILAALISRPIVSTDQIRLAVYRDRPADECGDKCVHVWIHHMRRRLAPFGIKIQNVFAQGYRLTGDSRDRLAAMREAEKRAA